MVKGARGRRLRAAVVSMVVGVGCLGGATSAAQATPTLSVTGPASVIPEGGGQVAAGQAVFTVNLSEGTLDNAGVDVTIETAGQTAISNEDFQGIPSINDPSGLHSAHERVLHWDVGEFGDKTVTVPIIGDESDENDESFVLKLSFPTGGAVLAAGASTGVPATIQDDDPPPTVSIADAQVTEVSNAVSLIAFQVSLSKPSGKTVSVKWATQNGDNPDASLNATAPADFTSNTQTLTFPKGVTGQFVQIQVQGDTLDEKDEKFSVVLDPLTPDMNATIGDGTAIGTILDDDGPNISIAGTTITEGPAGTDQIARLTVTLSALSPQDVSVAYATADATAKAPGDYDASPANARLTIPSGQIFAFIEVPIHGDDTDEADETLNVNLTAPTGGAISTAAGVITITDDDVTPGVAASNVRVTEGTGTTTNAIVTVRLSAPSAKTLTSTYTSSDGSAGAGVDYAAQNGTLTFNAGDTSKDISIPIGTDNAVEEDETFSLSITNTADGADPIVVTVTIVDDDLSPTAMPAVSVSDGTPVREGDTGQKNAVFTIRLESKIPRHVTVRYATKNGTATAGSDYTAVSGMLTFPANEDVRTVTVPVSGDKAVENNEDFTLELTDPTSAKLGKNIGRAIIIEDDAGAGHFNVPGTVQLSKLLCRSGKGCKGLPVSWRLDVAGTLDIAISAALPAKASKAKSKKGAGAPKPRKLILVVKSMKAKSGKGLVVLRRAGGSVPDLLRKLRLNKIKAVTVSLTFTSRHGARDVLTLPVTLR